MTPRLSDHAKLIRGDIVSQFGEGYRQVSGPTLAEGTLEEVFRAYAALSEDVAAKAYLVIGNGNPLGRDQIVELVERVIHDPEAGR